MKTDLIKIYGKQRCQDMHNFLDKLDRYYDFKYLEANLSDFLQDLQSFTNDDLLNAIKLLRERESNFRLKFNEVFAALSAARTIRKTRIETEADQKQKPVERVPMPGWFREKFINPILKSKIM